MLVHATGNTGRRVAFLDPCNTGLSARSICDTAESRLQHSHGRTTIAAETRSCIVYCIDASDRKAEKLLRRMCSCHNHVVCSPPTNKPCRMAALQLSDWLRYSRAAYLGNDGFLCIRGKSVMGLRTMLRDIWHNERKSCVDVESTTQ